MKINEVAAHVALQLAPVFQTFGWKWAKARGMEVPGYDDIAHHVAQTLVSIDPLKEEMVSSGRITIIPYRDHDKNPRVQIYLELYDGEFPTRG